MQQQLYTAPTYEARSHSSSAFMYIGLFFGILACAMVVFGVYFTDAALFKNVPSASAAQAAVAPVERHVHLNLSIVINQPGLHKDWPAYTPANIVVPANSLVTVTLRNYDLGDTPLTSNSPFTRVQGVTNGTAYVDGKAYSSLAPEKVAHTFTIPALHLNVPVPGDGAKGASFLTVTFTFHTGKAGSYMFQCFDPCGTGSSGWMGPMMTKGYMTGTLTVQ